MKSKPWYLLPSPYPPSLAAQAENRPHSGTPLPPAKPHFWKKNFAQYPPLLSVGHLLILWRGASASARLPVGANGCLWVPLQMGVQTIFCHLTIFCCSTRQNFWGLSVTENFNWCQLFFSSLTTLMRVVLVGKVDTIVMSLVVMTLWWHCLWWHHWLTVFKVLLISRWSSLAPRKDRLLENLE